MFPNFLNRITKSKKFDIFLNTFESRYDCSKFLMCVYFETIVRLSTKQSGDDLGESLDLKDEIKNYIVEAVNFLTGEKNVNKDSLEIFLDQQHVETLVNNAMQDNDFYEFIAYTLKIRDRNQIQQIGKKYYDSDEFLAHEHIYIKFGIKELSNLSDLYYESLLKKYYEFYIKSKNG